MRRVPSGTPVWRAISRIVRASGTSSGGGLQGRAGLAEAESDAALGGAERDALDAGDLLAREAAAVREQERLALIRGKAIEGAEQVERALAADHGLGGGLGRGHERTLLPGGAVYSG